VDAWEITPSELRRRLDRGDTLVLVDVRETSEDRVDTLPESRLIPLSELRYRGPEELYPDDEIVLFCRFGDRSLTAATILWDMGYEHVRCLAGGVDRWMLGEPRCPSSRKK
jgi:adenylyltransferase/sulfurtransferase